jgi:hypothetical protein
MISFSLNKLELQSIPLTEKELSCLAKVSSRFLVQCRKAEISLDNLFKGLKANKTLKSLSLDSCLIADEGLQSKFDLFVPATELIEPFLSYW